MIPVLILLLVTSLSILPEVMSYAKVSRNGQEEKESRSDETSWIAKMMSQSNGTENEGRSAKTIAITMSPVYVPQKIPKLQNGEAVDYHPISRYTTLDHELIAKLNAQKQIQDRYHPGPVNHNKNKNPPSNTKEPLKPAARPNGPPSPSAFDFSNPPFSEGYDYKPPDFLSDKPISKPQSYFSDGSLAKPPGYFSDGPLAKPPDYFDDKPMSKPPDDSQDRPISKPLSMEDYPSSEIHDKPPDSYMAPHGPPDYPDFSSDSSYNNDAAPKPVEFSGHLDHPPFDDDDNSFHHHHDFHHEVIYDHIPEHYEEHTEEPEMNDQRLDKRPYSYYFIGKKLWYLPLYFSIYFIIYIAALVLKSIARHKITFPAHLAEAVGHGRAYSDFSWWDYTGRVLEGIENFAEKYGKAS